MTWTKPTFYFTLITFVLVIFTSLIILGDKLNADTRIELNNDSLDYLDMLKGIEESEDMNLYSTDTEYINNSIMESDDDLSTGITDFLATLNIKKERISKTIGFFKLIYNIPSSLLLGIGFPIDEARNIINIIGGVLFIALLIMVWTRLINT